MYRLLLVLGLLVILYFLLRRAFRGFKKSDWEERGMSADQDQMVQDPVCQTFVPRKIAVVEKIGGETHFFCSRECAAKFQNKGPG
jgi:YHS domain-containing protein